MIRSTRKPSLWTLRKVSNRNSLSMPALATSDIYSSPPVDLLFHESLLYTSIPLWWNVSGRISLRGLRRLIRIDTLCRVYNVGFLVERFLCTLISRDSLKYLWHWFYCTEKDNLNHNLYIWGFASVKVHVGFFEKCRFRSACASIGTVWSRFTLFTNY